MSTRSRSASAPKAERAWTPAKLAGWLSDQATHPGHMPLYRPGPDAQAHVRLAVALLDLTMDRTPLPLTPDDVPLLP